MHDDHARTDMNEPNRTSMPTCLLSVDATLAASFQSYDRRQAQRYGRHVDEDVPNRALSVQSSAGPLNVHTSALKTQGPASRRHGGSCEGFRMPAADGGATGSGGRRRKASKGGNRDGARVVVPRSYGESTAVALERERNFSVDV